MVYAARRIAPLGPVGLEVAGAAFVVFHRDRLMRALPDAWSFGGPEACLRARSDGAVTALRRVADEVEAGVEEAADLATRADAATDTSGRLPQVAAAGVGRRRPTASEAADC